MTNLPPPPGAPPPPDSQWEPGAPTTAKPWWKRTPVIIAGAVVLLVVIVAAVSGGGSDGEDNTVTAGSSTTVAGPDEADPEATDTPADTEAPANTEAPTTTEAATTTIPPTTAAPATPMEFSGDGQRAGEPFELAPGNYLAAYSFDGDCFYGATVKPTDPDAFEFLDAGNGMGPLSGDTNLYGVEGGEYFLDMITGPPPGCPWKVTLTPQG